MTSPSVAASIERGVRSTLAEALFTSTSSRPNRAAVSSTTRWQAAPSVRSAVSARHSAPRARTAAAVSSSFAASRAQIATRAPSSANAMANSRPSPRLAPVISTTALRSFRSMDAPRLALLIYQVPARLQARASAGAVYRFARIQSA